MDLDLNVDLPFPPTLDDQIRCIQRELARRQRMYPARVKTHRIPQATADREIAQMAAALETLRSLSTEKR